MTNRDRNEWIVMRWNDGVSARQIAKQLAISRDSVLGIVFRARHAGKRVVRPSMGDRVRRAKAIRRAPSGYNRHEFLALWRECRSLSVLCDKFDCSRSVALSRLGFARRSLGVEIVPYAREARRA